MTAADWTKRDTGKVGEDGDDSTDFTVIVGVSTTSMGGAVESFDFLQWAEEEEDGNVSGEEGDDGHGSGCGGGPIPDPRCPLGQRRHFIERAAKVAGGLSPVASLRAAPLSASPTHLCRGSVSPLRQRPIMSLAEGEPAGNGGEVHEEEVDELDTFRGLVSFDELDCNVITRAKSEDFSLVEMFNQVMRVSEKDSL